MQVEPRLLIAGTGNNVVVAEDMTRRTLICRIDPKVENPEQRSFSFDPVEVALANRYALYFAAHTIVIAHMRAGCPGEKLLKSKFGSFNQWSKLIRAALVWLGEADPLDTMSSIQNLDPVKSMLKRSFHILFSLFGENKYFTASEIMKLAGEGSYPGLTDEQRKILPDLRDILSEAMSQQKSKSLDPQAIGRFLKAHRDRVVDGLSLLLIKSDGNKGHTYAIRPVNHK